MYAGKLVFSQVMDHLPWHTFQRCVRRYDGNHKVKSFQCSDQYRSMAFAQLTYCESLRDIETCLRAQASKLYHMGITSGISRNTLANANQTRDWHLYADFAQRLIHTARRLYAEQDRTLVFLTNQVSLPPLTIAELYRSRWQIELFFRWIKQRLRIKAFYGASENAVKSQIWIAVSVYVLIAIIKNWLRLEPNLYTILQILSLTVFEKTPLDQLLRREPHILHRQGQDKQLILFD